MAWSKRPGGDNEGLESKKRKLNDVDDDWDDDAAFTQADMEELDVIASQAICQASQINLPTDPLPPPMNVTLISTKRSLKLSSSSSNGSLQPQSSSNERSDKDSFQTNLEKEIKKIKDERNRYLVEVRYWKDITHKQESQAEQLRAELEEIKEECKLAKNEKIRVLENEVDKLISEKQFKENESAELQRQCQSFSKKIRRLEAQLQQLQTSCTASQPTSQSPEKASPKKVTVQPSPPSRKQQKSMDNLPQSQQTFPSYQSFVQRNMAQNNEMKVETNLLLKTPIIISNYARCAKCDASQPLGKFHLNIGNIKPKNNAILSKLWDSSSFIEKKSAGLNDAWVPGLIPLLGSAASLTGKGTGISKLNRKTTKKEMNIRSANIVSWENYQLAYNGLLYLLNHQNLTKCQLFEGKHTESLFLLKTFLEKVGTSQRAWSLKTRTDQTSSEPSRPQPLYKALHFNFESVIREDNSISQAVYSIFPLLTDYIHHYIKFMESGAGRAAFSQSFSSTSSNLSLLSFEKQQNFSDLMDKKTGTFGGHDKKSNLNNATSKHLAMSSLQILGFLLQVCSELGHFILTHSTPMFDPQRSVDSASSSSTTTTEELELIKKSSSGDADDEQSTSSETQIIIDSPSSLRPGCGKVQNLFQSLVTLGSQYSEDETQESDVVNEALKCLTNLIQSLPEKYLLNPSRLDMLATIRVIGHIFRKPQCTLTSLLALKLLHAMLRCEPLVLRLCTKSDLCPLFLLHLTCSFKLSDCKLDFRMKFYQQYILCMAKILKLPSAMKVLLFNSCPCSQQIDVAVVKAVYHILLHCPPVSPAEHLLKSLQQGVFLMHGLSHGGLNFTHSSIKPFYLRLILGLKKLFVSQPKKYKFTLYVIEEMDEFELLSQEIVDLSD